MYSPIVAQTVDSVGPYALINLTFLSHRCAISFEKASPAIIKRGHWCRLCSYEKRAYSIKDMQELAAISGGKCLSKKYVNIAAPLRFKCAKGHVWSTRPSSILKGSWCPTCAGRRRGTIGQMRKIARSRGGKCLSKSYVNTRTSFLVSHDQASPPTYALLNIATEALCAY